DEIDFVGTCVGLVEQRELLGAERVGEGDAVVGLPSSGLHANGFTLVRRLLGDEPPDVDLLLAPTRLYVDDIRSLRAESEVRALAHITGGGIPANLARVIPAGLCARLDPTSWDRPAVFDWLTARGVSEAEQRSVFNLGVGMCAVVSQRTASRAGFPVIGRVEAGASRVVID
ncbi:MAG: AIR synthase-related protein, partial [Gaiellales bacterium]